MRLIRFNSCKQSSRFESKNVHFWSPVDSPFEICFLEVRARYVYVIVVKMSLRLKVNNNETTHTGNDHINVACAQCTVVILFD